MLIQFIVNLTNSYVKYSSVKRMRKEDITHNNVYHFTMLSALHESYWTLTILWGRYKVLPKWRF